MSNIKISRLSFRYDDASNNIFNNLNLNLDSSWKLGLVGRNGRGKTTFLHLLRKNYTAAAVYKVSLLFLISRLLLKILKILLYLNYKIRLSLNNGNLNVK